MRLLVDTHVLIWALSRPERLSGEVQNLLRSREHAAFFSAASIWEIAIKAQARPADFDIHADEIAAEAVRAGFEEIAVTAAAASAVAGLPMHHRDPFDRLLIAQALTLPARFLTADRALLRYSELVTLV